VIPAFDERPPSSKHRRDILEKVDHAMRDTEVTDPALKIHSKVSHPFHKKRGKDGARRGVSFGPDQ
jgi:hypothetical protein